MSSLLRGDRFLTATALHARDRAVGGHLLASAIAYRLFLWLLPMCLALAAGLGFAESSGSGGPEDVGRELGFGTSAVDVVAQAAEQAERGRWALLGIALVGVYSAGGSAAKTLVAVHRFAWGEPIGAPPRRPSAGLAFTGGALGCLACILAAHLLRRASPGVGLAAALAIVIVFGGAWLVVSLVLPHADARWTQLLPGALLVGIGSQLLHLGSVYYLAGRIETSSELYGGLGVAASLLVGLYVLARLMVASALLNASRRDLPGKQDEQGTPA